MVDAVEGHDRDERAAIEEATADGSSPRHAPSQRQLRDQAGCAG
jgi:hypothetical protein